MQQFPVKIRGTKKKRLDAVLDISDTHITCSIGDAVQFSRPLADVKAYNIQSGRITLNMLNETDMMSILAIDLWSAQPSAIANAIIYAAGASRVTDAVGASAEFNEN